MSHGAVQVLIVDDHRLVREGLRRTLEDAGVEVVGEAADGTEALSALSHLDPDVVLMDISMPGLDGVATTRRLKSRGSTVPVVILTMHAEEELVARAREAGAVGYLLKDSAGEDVVAAVRHAAAGHLLPDPGRPGNSMRDGAHPAPVEVDPGLTPREIEILQLLAEGAAPADVARALHISPKTIRNHLTHAYDKLDVSSRSQAIVAAHQRGLITIP